MLIIPVISFLLYFVSTLRGCSAVFVVFRHVCFYLLSCGPQIRFSLWHCGVFLPAEEIHRDSLAMFMQGTAHNICICILKCPCHSCQSVALPNGHYCCRQSDCHELNMNVWRRVICCVVCRVGCVSQHHPPYPHSYPTHLSPSYFCLAHLRGGVCNNLSERSVLSFSKKKERHFYERKGKGGEIIK